VQIYGSPLRRQRALLPIFSAHLMETNADDDEQDGFIDASCTSEFKSVDTNQKRFAKKK
jgi:hypothetical protein